MNVDGNALVYSGFIGGSSQDEGRAIAVDSTGAAYIAGYTASNEASFPVTGGPDLTHNGGTFDAFIAKVRSDGYKLVYAGYLGGPGIDFGYSIDFDSTGAAYTVGYTNSQILNYSGGYDAFVIKVRPDGIGLMKALLIGGTGNDYGTGVAINADNAVYVAGYTTSNETTFPVKDFPYMHHSGGEDAFVIKINAAWKEIVYSGYIGGVNADRALDIAVDWRGSAYIVGLTMSENSSFPDLFGPDTTHNGGYDAFVAKVNMIYKTYLPVISRH